MTTIDQINYLEKKINKLPSSSNRRKKLDKKLNLLIQNHLEENSTQFKSIIEDQYKLLQNKIQFKPTQSRNVMFGTHALKYYGSVHKNGFAYLNVKKHNMFTINPFACMRYPSRFRGTIDYMGKIQIKAIDFDYKLIKSLPSQYDGNIEKNGFISLTTSSSELELSDGMIIKMVGRIFPDESYRSNFQNNKYLLWSLIREYKNNNNS